MGRDRDRVRGARLQLGAVAILIQLSDPHIGADWGFEDPVAQLERAVAAVAALDLGAHAILVTGDLADHADEGEYAIARERLDRLGAPLVVLPGNHDRVAPMGRAFDLADVADAGGLRVVTFDTTIPGSDAGAVDAARLARLDATLADAPDRPTIVAMHHPPLHTGLAGWDDSGLAGQDALGEVIARHPQVALIAAGHVHRAMTATLAGRPVMTVPSTYVQLRADARGEVDITREPSAFAVHAVHDGRLVSQLQVLS